MRTFSELTARDMVWQGDIGLTIPDHGDFHFVLYDRQEAVATAHVVWQRQGFFDVTLESGDGVFQSHMDLTRNDRPTLVWRPGEDHTVVSMVVTWEQIIACGGSIDTQSGRKLLLEPTHQMGYEYAIFPQGGARILTLAGPANSAGAFGGANPGHMSIEPASATDAELPALVTLAFTVATEEVRLLHQGSRG